VKRRGKGRVRTGGHDWLDLVARSGLVVTEPVLEEHYPDGPDPLPRGARHWFRRRAERYRLARHEHDSLARQGKEPKKARAAVHRWVQFILEELLEHPPEAWAWGGDIPPSCRCALPAYEQELRPDRVLLHDGEPVFLVSVVVPGQHLDRKGKAAGRWRATPAERMERLLRETGHRLGLVTNGEDWRLLHCPPAIGTGSITWTSRVLVEEKAVLDAFAMLLGRDLLRPGDGKAATLAALCEKSIRRQAEVADRLGLQVRQGLEYLLLALDRADKEAGGALLKGMTEEQVYEMLLVVMMRLLFLLFAEERHLLPHGQLLYDQGYGVTHLWQELREREASLDDSYDAWARFLATCRLIHQGSEHPDLSLRAYGGLLFDPARFPALEDPACRVPNLTVYRILDQLLFARQRKRGPRQRVGYWSLGEEEIGYLYEGLLDHRVARAGAEPMVKLKGGGEEAVPLPDLESRSGDELFDFVLERSGGKKTEAGRKNLQVRMEEGPGEEDLQALSPLPSVLANRVCPFAPLVQCDEVVAPGRFYLTTGLSRRVSGSHYTPEDLTYEIVLHTLEPLVYQCEEGKPGKYVLENGHRVLKSAREILDLKVADIAMGSGAFLVQVVRYLGDRLVEAWDRCAAEGGEAAVLAQPYGEPSREPERDLLIPFDNRDEMKLWARRQVTIRCVYGVDRNPLAVEMAKLSLWLVTLGRDHPFTFLDHALRCGDSLLGLTDPDQVRHFHMDPERGRELHETLFDYTRVCGPALERAVELRRKIESSSVESVEDAEEKAVFLEQAEQALDDVRLIADLVVASALCTAGGKAKALERRLVELAPRLAEAFEEEASEEAARETKDALREEVRAMLAGLPAPDAYGHRPFHWMLEYPEVFLGTNGGAGFAALVGNPPFQGGQKITGFLGKSYREYLIQRLADGKRGSADLCAYFYLRAGSLLRPDGRSGLLATNTIAQGDTREVGLDQLLERGFSIPRAVPSRPWPGEASLEVAQVWLHRGDWHGDHFIESRQVPGITSFLVKPGAVAGKPHRLAANAGKSFQGSNVLGMGFVLTPDEAQTLIEKDPRNEDVLYPYLNGKDLNSRADQSASRWVISFHDWPLDRDSAPPGHDGPVAADYADCLAIVLEKVKPQRDELASGDATARDRARRWWQFARPTARLYAATEDLAHVLMTAQTARRWAISRLPTGTIWSHTTVVFPLNEWPEYAILQGTFHEDWRLEYGPSLRQDARYAPSDCFDTFPFPTNLTSLATIGERYHRHRAKLMLSRQQGLTATYNRFHDPDEKAEDIQKLRDLHVEMDQAVSSAYGWNDLDLDHGFHQTKQGLRFTISEDARQEVVDRLLALNHQRYQEEVEQGLHEKKARKKPPKKQPLPKVAEQRPLYGKDE